MSISRPFAYNPPPNPPIAGTTQIGDLSLGDVNWPNNQNYGGVFWWQGPDEELGYVIAYPQPNGLHPNPSSLPAFVGFKRSKFLTEESFIIVANSVAAGATAPFTSGNQASTWLTNNGYWNSWVFITPTPTATLALTPTPTSSASVTPTPTITNTPTITQTPTSTPTESVLINPILAGVDEYIEVGINEYLMFT